MHEKYDIKFDAGKLFDYFGGVPASVEALKTIGMTVKAKRLQKQKERGQVPAEVVASLMVASSRMGRPLNPYDYLIERVKE